MRNMRVKVGNASSSSKIFTCKERGKIEKKSGSQQHRASRARFLPGSGASPLFYELARTCILFVAVFSPWLSKFDESCC